MHRKARATTGDQHAGVHNDASRAVHQHDVRPIGDFATIALYRQACEHSIGQAEQQQRLIDQMRSQVVPEAAARSGLLAPTYAHLRAEAIDMRLEMLHIAQYTIRHRLLHAQKIAVPTAVLKYR